MYRKPKFLEVLHEIREEMSREADYDIDLFAELVRSDKRSSHESKHRIINIKSDVKKTDDKKITKSKRRRVAGF